MVTFISNSGDSDRNNDHDNSNNTASSHSRHVQDAVITAWAVYHCRESCERSATTSFAMLATSPTSSACQAELACALAPSCLQQHLPTSNAMCVLGTCVEQAFCFLLRGSL